MQAAQRAPLALSELLTCTKRVLQALAAELLFAKEPREEAAVVAASLELDQIGALQRGLGWNFIPFFPSGGRARAQRRSASSRPAAMCRSSVFSRI